MLYRGLVDRHKQAPNRRVSGASVKYPTGGILFAKRGKPVISSLTILVVIKCFHAAHQRSRIVSSALLMPPLGARKYYQTCRQRGVAKALA